MGFKCKAARIKNLGVREIALVGLLPENARSLG
jgi:hypothetical protein